MFTQLIDPLNNLTLTCLVALIPVVFLLVLLAVFRVPAWLAATDAAYWADRRGQPHRGPDIAAASGSTPGVKSRSVGMSAPHSVTVRTSAAIP